MILTIPIYDGGLRYGQDHERKALATEAHIAGFTSELLILGAKNADGKVIVLSPRSEIATGEPVY